ncbi:K-box region and MADS-box transcription factor family protein [Striga asiatica]|uniref:K-box region and MADS-box transcription factor family protein n=1 Tax=Striga asiatica TaxID=4170 RepID=A0A5A7QA27_STRAF|nr:K-box region and MADS-box transcription factor family protein [Striga asiatica]
MVTRKVARRPARSQLWPLPRTQRALAPDSTVFRDACTQPKVQHQRARGRTGLGIRAWAARPRRLVVRWVNARETECVGLGAASSATDRMHVRGRRVPLILQNKGRNKNEETTATTE